MRFENSTMVWAFLAVMLPIAIHYLFKRRYETFVFGAMAVVRMALNRRKDRILLEHVAVVAARVLMLAFLSCAMLAPVIGRKASAQRPATCMVMLFDDSYSMLAGEDISRFEQAKTIGANLADAVESGDEVYVLGASSPAAVAGARPYRDGGDAKAAIRALPVAWQPRDLAGSVRAVASILNRSKCERRELFIFTDRQALGFGLENGTGGNASDPLVRWKAIASELRRLSPAPRIFWVEPGKDTPSAARAGANLTVAAIRPAATVFHAGIPAAFFVTVRNVGDEAVSRADLRCLLDGRPVAETSLSLTPRGTATARFPLTFDKAGSYRIRFQVQSANDLLAEDNTLFYAVQVEDPLPLLVVDGNLSPEPLKGESDFVHHALSPSPDGKSVAAGWNVRVVSPADMHRLTQWNRRFSAIVFLNVREPDEPLITKLEQYVASGGALFLALGDRCGIDDYNLRLYRSGRGLIPCELLSREGDPAASERFQSPRIAANDPALALFGPDEAGLDKAKIRAWFKTRVPPSLRQTRTVLTLAPSGDPLLYARPFGRGSVYVFTTGVNLNWGDLPIHPGFVLLMRGVADAMRAAQVPPRCVAVGESLEAVFRDEARGFAHVMTAPERLPEKLPVRRRFGSDQIQYTRTQRPGFYELTSEREGERRVTYYAVNPDTRESDLAPVPEAQLKDTVSLLGARHVGAWSELESLFKRARRGAALWWVFLLLVVAFLFIEIALARIFQRSFVDEKALEHDALQGASLWE